MITLEYENSYAAEYSVKGNPIHLYALQVQGYNFQPGASMPMRNGTIVNFFAGLRVVCDDPTVRLILSPKSNLQFPSIVLLNAGVISPEDAKSNIHLKLGSFGGDTVLVDFGLHIADLHFIKAADI